MHLARHVAGQHKDRPAPDGGHRSKIPTAGHGAASPTFTAFALDGQAIISPDPVPLRLTKMNSDFQERIIAILLESPNGLTSNEIAERLGATAKNVSSRLSKLAGSSAKHAIAVAQGEMSIAH